MSRCFVSYKSLKIICLVVYSLFNTVKQKSQHEPKYTSTKQYLRNFLLYERMRESFLMELWVFALHTAFGLQTANSTHRKENDREANLIKTS